MSRVPALGKSYATHSSFRTFWLPLGMELDHMFNCGKMVEMWSLFGASPPARVLGEPWTWWIASTPVQMSGCYLGAALSWFAWWAACRGWLFFIDPSFLVNSYFDHSWAWIPACSLTADLLYRCFPSNLSTTTQGAIVKLRGASSELCTLFIWSV